MTAARRHAWRPWQRYDKGFVLIALLALLAMGGLYFLVSNLSPEFIRARSQQQTGEALTQAREALIGYAIQYREQQQATGGTNDAMYGFLPMPDVGTSRFNAGGQPSSCNTEGCAMAFINGAFPSQVETVIGRFPWRTVGTGPLRDSNGECLWYIVSANFKSLGIDSSLAMNWDTLGQIDIVVANGTAAMVSAVTSAHDRPIAVIFSPGPPLPGQDRGTSATDTVAECGGNYEVSNYLDPKVATDLVNITNYFAGSTNSASGDTSGADKKLSAGGLVNSRNDGSLWAGNCPSGSSATCSVVANDSGVGITSDLLFRILRGSSYFRTDINTMLDRMAECLRDEIIANGGSLAPPYAKIAGADANTCYGAGVDPLGYYPHYKEMIFVAAPGSTTVTVDGVDQSCAAALVFAGQRDSKTLRCPVGSPASVQSRSSGTETADYCNYLEDTNLTSFTTPGTTFSGQNLFDRVSSTQTAYQDIVRCIPASKSFTEAPSALPAGSELSSYDAATRTLTLGRENIESDEGYNANTLFGCVWTPEVHATGSGVRAYFKFMIDTTNTGGAGEGFTFAAIDGDRNGSTVCGAAVQHLGYSGNNSATPIIAYPKIGIEFDTRKQYKDGGASFTDPTGFNPAYNGSTPSSTSYLNNGRADPSYTGGHMGVVYWGGETAIFTRFGFEPGSCTSPQYKVSFGFIYLCYLNPEEDDNVHGRTASPPSSRPPPRNPVAPVAVPAIPAGVYKLDPSLSSVPVDQDIHVRVEIDRTQNSGRDDHAKRVRLVSTGNLALTGLQTVDTISLAAGNRVLLTAQTDAKENGVWIAAAGAWARATTENEGLEFPVGSSWFVNEGNTYTGTLWRLQNSEAMVIGTSQINIAKYRDPVRTRATGNLTLSGLQTVNGVALASGDRVLLTAQTSTSQNGVYTASAGGWTRATLENTAAGMKAGATWYVTEGGSAGSFWHTTADASPGGVAAISISQVTSADNTIYFSTVKTQVWKLPDSPTSANQIANMKLTSRPLSLLDPGHLPLLSDTATVYDLKGSTCNSTLVCSSGQFCGIDNNCYSPAFRTMRLGFTNSQSTRDQVINISNFTSTWLP